jgi:hypothetical protein
MELLKQLLLPLADMYEVSMVGLLLAIIFVVFLELINTLQVGYMGIIIGHRGNNNKMGRSILCGFISYLGMQMFAVLCTFMVSLFNKDMMNLFFTNEIVSIEMIKVIVYMSFVIYSISLIVTYFINLKLFKKGINID